MKILGFIWALPTTLVGVLFGFGSLLGGGYLQCHSDAVVEFVGGLYARWVSRFGATTFGFVTLARNDELVERLRPHERVHTQQAMWLGPLFLPAYGLASVWARIRHGNWYWDNWFERNARIVSGVA